MSAPAKTPSTETRVYSIMFRIRWCPFTKMCRDHVARADSGTWVDLAVALVLRVCFAIQVARVHSLLSATLGCLPDLVCLGRMSLEEPIGFSVGNTFEKERLWQTLYRTSISRIMARRRSSFTRVCSVVMPRCG